MRIIAGKYRRRKLLTRGGLSTRPITDRAKEPLFERLERHLEGARIADVFAGTGTLGLEALSRGAHSVVFIEQDRKAVELLQKNVDSLGAIDCCLCWRTDVMRSSFRPQRVPDFVPFDLIFFDPPYRMIETLQPSSPLFKALERLGRSTVSAANAMLCLRTPADSTFAVPPVWRSERTLTISSMDMHLYQVEHANPETVAEGDVAEEGELADTIRDDRGEASDCNDNLADAPLGGECVHRPVDDDRPDAAAY